MTDPALAELVLVAHTAYVMFVATGFVLIPMGAWRRWRWTQTVRYRALHSAAIGYVALEQLLHIACPLTVLEYRLQGGSGRPVAFVPRLLHAILFHHWPPVVFTVLYVGLATLTLLFWWVFPPTRR